MVGLDVFIWKQNISQSNSVSGAWLGTVFVELRALNSKGSILTEAVGGILNRNLEGNAVSPLRVRTMLGSELF